MRVQPLSRAFFIAGLHRSGTSWIANAINVASSKIACFHELESWGNMHSDWLLNFQYDFIGLSGPSVLDKWVDGYAGKRVLLVRDLEESKDALIERFGIAPTNERYNDIIIPRLTKWIEDDSVLKVAFSELFKVETVVDIIQFVTSQQVSIDRIKLRSLPRLNVSVHGEFEQLYNPQIINHNLQLL